MHPTIPLTLLFLTTTLASPITGVSPPSPPSWFYTDPKLSHDLRTTLDRVRKDWSVPGLAVSVIKDDAVIFSETFGVKNRKGEKVDLGTVFQGGSLTKV
ncbi:hypothetical protein HDV00_012533, partial [Rhizophlyctis rosea]